MDALADLWVSSDDRAAVTDAVTEVDRLLGDSPELRGEDFYGDRLLVVDPLWVTFQVQEDDRIVEISDVWHR